MISKKISNHLSLVIEKRIQHRMPSQVFLCDFASMCRALLDYYQTHDLAARILTLRTTDASFMDLLPKILAMSNDGKISSRKLRNPLPELMKYLYAAESSDSLAFRFFSYYNIFERFFDFVEYEELQIEIRKILERSDLYERIEFYTIRLAQYLDEANPSHPLGEDKL